MLFYDIYMYHLLSDRAQDTAYFTLSAGHISVILARISITLFWYWGYFKENVLKVLLKSPVIRSLVLWPNLVLLTTNMSYFVSSSFLISTHNFWILLLLLLFCLIYSYLKIYLFDWIINVLSKLECYWIHCNIYIFVSTVTNSIAGKKVFGLHTGYFRTSILTMNLHGNVLHRYTFKKHLIIYS